MHHFFTPINIAVKERQAFPQYEYLKLKAKLLFNVIKKRKKKIVKINNLVPIYYFDF